MILHPYADVIQLRSFLFVQVVAHGVKLNVDSRHFTHRFQYHLLSGIHHLRFLQFVLQTFDLSSHVVDLLVHPVNFCTVHRFGSHLFGLTFADVVKQVVERVGDSCAQISRNSQLVLVVHVIIFRLQGDSRFHVHAPFRSDVIHGLDTQIPGQDIHV